MSAELRTAPPPLSHALTIPALISLSVLTADRAAATSTAAAVEDAFHSFSANMLEDMDLDTPGDAELESWGLHTPGDDPSAFVATMLAQLRAYAAEHGIDFNTCFAAARGRATHTPARPTDARAIRASRHTTPSGRRHAVLPTDLRAALRTESEPFTEHGITQLIIHYEETPDQSVNIQYALGYDRAGIEHDVGFQIQPALDYAIQRLVPAMPDTGPGDYDGSRGWITLDLNKQTATIQHCWYVVQANDSPAFIASIAESPTIPDNLP